MPPGDSTEIAILQTKLQSLREMTEAKFEQVESQLDRLQDALDKVAAIAVTKTLYQQQIESIKRAHTRLNTHDTKLTRYEHVTRLLNVVWGIVGAIIVTVLIALVTGRAHIEWH